MPKVPHNPFKFGDPVDGEYYLPRKELSHVVAQFLENHIHVVLIGPRRFGKTSFVLNLLKEFEEIGFVTLFVDIFNITSHLDFLNQILRTLHNKKSWLEKLKKGVGKLRPKLTTDFDPLTGHHSLGLSLHAEGSRDVKEMIQEAFGEIVKFGGNILFVIDEFQKIAEIEDNGWLEATIRTYMQQMRHTTCLFTGSRKGIISDMLNNPAKPFYRSCQPIEFPAFGSEFTDWIVKKFAVHGIDCKKEAIDHLRSLVQDTPNYVQMVCFHLVAQGYRKIDTDKIDTTLATVVRQNAYAYQTLLSTLSLVQQRVLRLAAHAGKDIYSQDLLKKYEIGSPAAMASAIKALKGKEILDEEGTGRGKVIFDDPLFAIWLRVAFEDP